MSVTTLGIYSAAGSSDAKYHIQYSDNGTTWSTAFSNYRPVPDGWRQVTWAPAGAHRYWRLSLVATPTSSTAITELSFGGTNTFYGAPADAPDSLVRFWSGDTLRYRRNLKHGASVTFNQSGRHEYTTSRVGHRTSMAWTMIGGQTRLASITVPPNDGVTRAYTLNWDGTTGLLNYIQDPGSRQLTTIMSGSNLQKVRAPGGLDSTRFAYDARNVIIGRTATRQKNSTVGDTARTT